MTITIDRNVTQTEETMADNDDYDDDEEQEAYMEQMMLHGAD
jgi:hypothetical protein